MLGDYARATAPAQVFQREGEYWTIVYDGVGIHLRDTKGLRYLAWLLSHPGRRVPAVELAAGGEGGLRKTDPRREEAGGSALRPPQSAMKERARSAVSKRIKSAIAKVSQHHPALGYHLSTTIKTGAVCMYRAHPDQPLVWTV
jgi:hypothetical protein